MKIVIEVVGDQIHRVDSEVEGRRPPSLGRPVSMPTMPPPGPAPAALLERARKLGAVSAGAARWGTGAALAAAAESGESFVFRGLNAEAKPKVKRKAKRRR
jgi:hypothetical protein